MIKNSVAVGGAVYLPGKYDLTKNSTVDNLIKSAAGLKPDAVKAALIYRLKNGISNETVSLDLNVDNDLKKVLSDQDSLYVFSNKDISFKNFVSVRGEVNAPSELEFKYGLTLRDVILLSKGFTDFADKSNVSVIRNNSKLNSNELVIEKIVDLSNGMSNENNIELMPDDIVTVKSIPFYKSTKSYEVLEVEVQKVYPITTKDFNIKDAFTKILDYLIPLTRRNLCIKRLN